MGNDEFLIDYDPRQPNEVAQDVKAVVKAS
jgi:hypothetical protein